MPEPRNTVLKSLRVRPPLHSKTKSLAALAGRPLADFVGDLLTPALEKAERELRTARLDGERPSRGREIG